jgi:hypothetical protein
MARLAMSVAAHFFTGFRVFSGFFEGGWHGTIRLSGVWKRPKKVSQLMFPSFDGLLSKAS